MARKDLSMTDEELLAFLSDGAKTLQVASNDRDGYPHIVPMWFLVEDGKVVFRSFSKSQKIVNLRRNPKLSVLIESGETYDELKGVMIRGTATLIDDRATVLAIYGAIAAKYKMIGGESVQLEGAALEAAFGSYAEKNTAVVVEPIKVASWDHSKLGGAY